MTEPFPWQWLLWIAGVLVALGGAGNVVVKLLNPFRQMKKTLADIAARLDRHDALFAKDNERLKQEEACTTAILRAIYALLEHARTNNSTGLMEAASAELQRFLIERK